MRPLLEQGFEFAQLCIYLFQDEAGVFRELKDFFQKKAVDIITNDCFLLLNQSIYPNGFSPLSSIFR